MTMDGKLASQRLLGGLTDPDLGSVRMLSLPNTWNHVGSDHVVSFRVLPSRRRRPRSRPNGWSTRMRWQASTTTSSG